MVRGFGTVLFFKSQLFGSLMLGSHTAIFIFRFSNPWKAKIFCFITFFPGGEPYMRVHPVMTIIDVAHHLIITAYPSP